MTSAERRKRIAFYRHIAKQRRWHVSKPALVTHRSGSRARDGYVVPAFVLGAGIAAVFDGFVFHRALQWHHMLSAWHPPTTVANLKLNTWADGWFDMAAFALLLVGVSLLWHPTALAAPSALAAARSMCPYGGGCLQRVEGVVDHELLGIRHVREGAHAGTYDGLFLEVSVAMRLVGIYLLRRVQGKVG